LVPTLAPFSDFAAQATAPGVLISWKCPETPGGISDIQYLFRIYRRAESSSSESKIADVAATECALGRASSNVVTSFLDQTFEWEKTYFYRGTVVSAIEKAGKAAIEIEGEDTPEVKVFAHDVFPPAVPTGLQAVSSGTPQQPFIDLSWAPDSESDLAGYNVYRHEEGAAPVKINSEVVKAPTYRDTAVEAGRRYFYSVSAVDVRGNESEKSAETSEAVQQ